MTFMAAEYLKRRYSEIKNMHMRQPLITTSRDNLIEKNFTKYFPSR